MLIYHSSNDVTMPHIMHFSTPGAAEPFYVPWIADRFAGKPVANGCP